MKGPKYLETRSLFTGRVGRHFSPPPQAAGHWTLFLQTMEIQSLHYASGWEDVLFACRFPPGAYGTPASSLALGKTAYWLGMKEKVGLGEAQGWAPPCPALSIVLWDLAGRLASFFYTSKERGRAVRSVLTDTPRP